MKKTTILFILPSLFLLFVVATHAINFNVRIDPAYMWNDGGTMKVRANVPIVLEIQWENNDGMDWLGFSFIQKLYGWGDVDQVKYIPHPNGRAEHPSIATVNGIWGTGWPDRDDIRLYSWDGNLPDTMNHTAIDIYGGWPAGSPVETHYEFSFEIPLSYGETGYICIDSCGTWDYDYQWLFAPAQNYYGPYCFPVAYSIDDIPGSWDDRVAISDNEMECFFPRIEVNGDYIHTIWQDNSGDNLLYRRSTDGGDSWQAIKTLYSAGGPVPEVSLPQIAVRDNFVHIVWTSSGNSIKYIRSTDNGVTFQSPVILSTGGAPTGFLVDVASYENHVYVMWIKGNPDNDVIIKISSIDNGTTWSAHTNITNDGAATEERLPRIAAYGSYVYIAWIEDHTGSGSYANFVRSADYGVSWESPMTLYMGSLFSIGKVAIAAIGANVYYDLHNASGLMQIKSTDYGQSFGAAEIIGGSPMNQGPEIDASSVYTSHACNIYTEDTGPNVSDLIVSTGIDNEWLLGEMNGGSIYFDIAAGDDGSMHVVSTGNEVIVEPPSRVYYFRYHILTDPCDCDPGECDGGSPIDILDIVHLIDYKFKECPPGAGLGTCPPPTPYSVCSGDADCNCIVDILDIVRMIDWKFKECPPGAGVGTCPAPCSCEEWVSQCGVTIYEK
jgi:hypothetical protein